MFKVNNKDTRTTLMADVADISWQFSRIKCQKAFLEMHLFKCFVNFFKGDNKLLESITLK